MFLTGIGMIRNGECVDQSSSGSIGARDLKTVKKPKFRVFETGPKNVVSSASELVLYEPGWYGVFKVIEVRSLGYEWVLVFERNNGGNQNMTVKKTVKQGFVTTSGSSTTESISASLGAAAKGLSFTVEASTETKTFSEEELSAETSTEETFNIAANSYAAHYQLQYKFKTERWYKLDQGNVLWTVGNYKEPGVALQTFESRIKVDSFVLLSQKLTGKKQIKVKSVLSVENKESVISFEDIQDGAVRDFLHSKGL